MSVFETFSGIRPMAAKIGVPVSTVKSWRDKGHIPAWRHADILHAAKVHRLVVTEGDLHDLTPAKPELAKSRHSHTGAAA